MTNSICYGDVIYLQVRNLVLCSDDFYDQTLYLASTENATNNSFRNRLFKIYPKLPHDNHAAIKRAVHQLRLSTKLIDNGSRQEVEKKIQNEIKRSEQDGQSQSTLIAKIINDTQGQPIRYGQELQFLHVESQLFVSMSNDLNMDNQDVTGLELAHQGNKPVSFTFHPRLAYTYNGDIVEYDTPLDFISANTKTSLVRGVKIEQPTLEKGLNPADNPLTNQEDKFPRIEPRGKRSLSGTAEIFQAGIKLDHEEGEETYVRKFVSFEDQDRAHKKKLFKNGDYIRISNERIYMTAYNSGNDSSLFFQEFKDSRGPNYSITYSLFQIIEIMTDQNSQEDNESDREDERAPNLPQGHTLRYNPMKRYMLKHLLSGKYLALNSGSVQLLEYAKTHEESMKVSFIMRRNERGDPSNKYIGQNSIFELRFNNETLSQKRKILAIGTGDQLFTKQTDFAGSHSSGFKLTDDYLNKFLLTERFAVEAKGNKDARLSSFRLIHPEEIEISFRFQGEYLANKFQEFLNSLAKFIREPSTANKLIDLNKEAVYLSVQCDEYTDNMYGITPDGVGQKTEIVNAIRRVLLREYRVFDLMYRVLYYTLLDPNVSEKAKQFIDTNLKQTDSSQLNGVLDLLKSMKKLFLFSFTENDLNRHYCSQFIRVVISCAFYPDSGIFSLASDEERQEVKNITSQLCITGLWDQDINAFRQLNYYKSIFKSREKQIYYNPASLKLLNHIMKSEIPKVPNDFRNVFVQPFLADDSNIKDLFPQIYEEEKKIYLRYSQKLSQSKEYVICLNDLASKTFVSDKIYVDCFIEASNLICTLKKIGSPMFDSKIAEYYQLDVLEKAAQCIDVTSSYHQLRTTILKLISEIYNTYAPGLFKELPADIHINIEADKAQANLLLSEINDAIKESAQQGVSKTDTKYLKLQNRDRTLKDSEPLVPPTSGLNDEYDKSLLQKDPSKLLNNIHKKVETGRIGLMDFNLACQTFNILETNIFGSALGIITRTLNQRTSVEDDWSAVNFDELTTLLSNQNGVSDTSKALDIFLQALLLNQDKEEDSVEKGMNQEAKNSLTSKTLQYLRRVSNLENSIYKKIENMAFVFDLDTLSQIKHIMKASCRLKEISRTIIFHQDSAIKIQASVLLDLLKEVLDNQWNLFFIIYDTSKHFRYHDRETDQNNRFKEAFQNIKSNDLNLCTKLSLHAVNRLIQKIFCILSIHQTLDTILQWTIGHGAKSEILSQIIRLNTFLLTAFIMDNKNNQMICSTMKGFVKQFYIEDSIKCNPDVLLLFGELFRGNKELLELSNPILYEIVTSFLLKEMKNKISNTQENACLSASILNYHFWCQAVIPIGLYNPFSDIKDKWDDITQVDQFTSLNILQSTKDIIKLPYCYYSICELLSSTIEALDSNLNNKEDGGIALQLPAFSKLLSFFESENFILQYELKNMMAKCMIKAYFESGTQVSFIKTEECKHIIACLIADIVFFLKHASKTNKKVELSEKLIAARFISNNIGYINITKMYEQIDNNDTLAKNLQIYLEDISLETLYSEYIFDGCFNLLLHLLNNESGRYGQLISCESNETNSILDFSVKLLESLSKVQPLHENINTYLAMMLNIPGPNGYRDEIIKMRDADARSTKDIESNKRPSSKQRFQERIPLRKMRDYNDKQNIQFIVDHIVSQLKADDMIDKMVKFLQASDIKRQKEDIIFVLKVLRRYIEIKFTKNRNNNLYSMWEDINCAYPKEVEAVQEEYRSLGLTKILYKLLLHDDFEMLKEVISLSIVYVYGGNNKIQNEFYESFTADEESEVLSKLNRRLSVYFNMFKIQETKRINYLYTRYQTAGSRLLNGEKISWYTESAEKKEENQMFLLILTFLQALCERQFIEMQVFLREHRLPDHSCQRSFNVLGFLRDSMAAYCKILNKHNLAVGYKLMDLVTELVQGDVDENISIFLSQTLVYDLCQVLTHYSTNQFASSRGVTELTDRDLQIFNSKIIMLFKIILESCNESNRNVLREHLDIKGLIEIYKSLMTRISDRFRVSAAGRLDPIDALDELLAGGFNKSDLDNGLNIYIILRYLWNDLSDADFDKKLLEFLKDVGYSAQDEHSRDNVLTFSRRCLYDLEIVIKRETKTLIRVWFPLKSALQINPAEMLMGFFGAFYKYIKITNVSELLEHSQDLITLFKVNHQTKKGVGLLLRMYYFITLVYSYPVILAINIVNIATYKLENETFYQDSYNRKQVRNMNIAQIVLACSSLLFYWQGFKDSNVSTNWEKFVEKNTMKMKFLEGYIKRKLDSRRYSDLTRNECYALIKLKGLDSEEFQLIREHALTFKGFKLWLTITNAWFSIKSSEIMSRLLYVAIAIGSLFHPLVAMLQLYFIASGSETVKQIARAVFKNSGQLIWTLALLLFATAVYSTIGFFFLNDTFVNSNDNNRLCDTAFACFINVLNLGIRSGGGIGDVIQPIPYEGHNTASFFWMAMFNLSFYVIVIILLLSIIFGMIIDAFGEIRDENVTSINNMRNVCAVCGLERKEIEKYADFGQHRAIEHNKMVYVFYIAYLLDKQKNDKNSLTEIENYVMDMFRTKNDDWIPIGRSLTLERAYKKEKVNKESEIDMLTKKVDDITILLKDKAQKETDE